MFFQIFRHPVVKFSCDFTDILQEKMPSIHVYSCYDGHENVNYAFLYLAFCQPLPPLKLLVQLSLVRGRCRHQCRDANTSDLCPQTDVQWLHKF